MSEVSRRSFITRIERFDSKLNAIVVRNFDRALEAARAADAALAKGTLLGPLHGLPMTIKDWDILVCPIMPTTAMAHDHSPQSTRMIAVNGEPVPYLNQLFWAGNATLSYLPRHRFPDRVVQGRSADRAAGHRRRVRGSDHDGICAPDGG